MAIDLQSTPFTIWIPARKSMVVTEGFEPPLSTLSLLRLLPIGLRDHFSESGAQGGSWTHKTLFLRQRCFPITSLEHTCPPGVNTNTSPLEQYPTRRYAVRSVRLELTISCSQSRRNSHYPTNGFGGATGNRTLTRSLQSYCATIITMTPN
jgi:hypothetical protein